MKRLLKPNGKFILSNWQFLNSDKLKARIQPWDRVGLTDEDMDEGDYLLDWRSGGEAGLRYAHHFSAEELLGLAGAEPHAEASGRENAGHARPRQAIHRVSWWPPTAVWMRAAVRSSTRASVETDVLAGA